MAEYEINVASQCRMYIQTNKGPFWFTVVETDTEFVGMQDRYVLKGNLYYRSLDSSIVHHRYIERVAGSDIWVNVNTPFESVDGKLRGVVEGNDEQMVIYFNNNEVYRSIVNTNPYHTICIGALLIHFSNGYSLCANGSVLNLIWIWNNNYPAPDEFRIYPNGPHSFGNLLCKNTDSNWVTLSGFSAADLELGEYMYGSGRLYADPYDGGGEDDPEGETDDGPGTWELPTDELANGGTVYSDLTAGLYRAYAMTASQLLAFSNQLWEVNVLRDLRELIEKPAEIALGLFSYPFDVSSENSAVQIGFNWLSHWSSTNVYGYPIDSEIMYLDFGDITIDRYSGCFYDYQPFSIIQLHLPYIGFVPLKMSECTGRTLHISYCIDVLNGDFTAHVTSSGYEEHYGVQLLGTYQGNIGKPMPLSQQSIFELVKRGAEIGTAALSMAGAVFMGGGAAIAALDTANRIQEMSSGSGEKEAMKSAQKLLQHQEASLNRSYQTFRRSGHSIVNNIGNLGEGAGAISRSGSVDGSVGRTSPQQCFAIIQYPDQSRPSNQEILGYPSNIPGPLSKVLGYTEVREIHLHAGMATEGEMAEIEEIVRGGILI